MHLAPSTCCLYENVSNGHIRLRGAIGTICHGEGFLIEHVNDTIYIMNWSERNLYEIAHQADSGKTCLIGELCFDKIMLLDKLVVLKMCKTEKRDNTVLV